MGAITESDVKTWENESVGFSEIFKWYIEDFGGSLDSVHGYVNRYINNPIPDHYGKNYYSYDWQLNSQ